MSTVPNPIPLDLVLFRAQFPAFESSTKYPDVLIQMYWDEVTCIISDQSYGLLYGCCRQLALNMLLAHFLGMAAAVNKGRQGGFVSSSTIDKVSVTKAAPPTPDMFSWWLSQTPYGIQLLALLDAKSVGGYYIGGRPESSAFRRVGGFF